MLSEWATADQDQKSFASTDCDKSMEKSDVACATSEAKVALHITANNRCCVLEAVRSQPVTVEPKTLILHVLRHMRHDRATAEV